MNYKEVNEYYSRLENGAKGKFTAYLSLNLGGSPHSWQTKILSWAKGLPKRNVSPVIMSQLTQIIKQEMWNG